MWKQNIQFAFIYNFMTQTRTIFILQSYVWWSLRTVVHVSYLWAKRQEVLWLRRKCKMKNPIQSYCCLFLFSVAQRCVLNFFAINFSTYNRLAHYFFYTTRLIFSVMYIKFKSNNDGSIKRVISSILNVYIWFHILKSI